MSHVLQESLVCNTMVEPNAEIPQWKVAYAFFPAFFPNIKKCCVFVSVEKYKYPGGTENYAESIVCEILRKEQFEINEIVFFDLNLQLNGFYSFEEYSVSYVNTEYSVYRSSKRWEEHECPKCVYDFFKPLMTEVDLFYSILSKCPKIPIKVVSSIVYKYNNKSIKFTKDASKEIESNKYEVLTVEEAKRLGYFFVPSSRRKHVPSHFEKIEDNQVIVDMIDHNHLMFQHPFRFFDELWSINNNGLGRYSLWEIDKVYLE